MSFFNPKGIFFVINQMFNGDTQKKLQDWLNTLSSITIFNNERSNIFVGDEMITFGKSLDFLREERFVELANDIFINDNENINDANCHRALIWRRYILIWAAEHCKKLEGSFCDFGCYDGLASKFINEYCTLNEKNIKFFLYDVFDNPPQSKKFPKHSDSLFDEVSNSFKGSPNVEVVKGILPNSLKENYPEKISFAHIDLNNVDAEMGVLKFIFDKISPGGIVIFDDYGWFNYEEQKNQEKKYIEEKGLRILELPTGQGLFIKR